ncbi:MAG: hypothetical protein ABSF44_11415 [Candidatus Bathyarchaeia archaeon]
MIASQPPNAPLNESFKSKAEAQKKLVEELKVQWKLLWSERFDDKELAEGVSVNDYSILRVERGTVIHATRNFKALSFKEILEQHMVENPDRFVQPETNAGGWSKFIKKEITNQSLPKRGKRAASYLAEKPDKPVSQQPKKGGRGWLHF